MTQSAATTALTGAGLALGTVSSPSSIVPSGSVIAEPRRRVAGESRIRGRALVSTGQARPPAPNPLSLENNYFVTGDYAAAGVTLRGTGQSGMATGTINIPDSTTNPGVSQGVPDGADIIDGFLYWETLENTPSPSGNTGTFLGFPITGQQIGSDMPYTDGALSGTLRVYRADVNTYFPVGANEGALPARARSRSLCPTAEERIPGDRRREPGGDLSRIVAELPAQVCRDLRRFGGANQPRRRRTCRDSMTRWAERRREHDPLLRSAERWNNSSSSVSLGSAREPIQCAAECRQRVCAR